MLGIIGNLFVKCMEQVTKGHWYHLLGVSDYYVMYRQRAQCHYAFTISLIISSVLLLSWYKSCKDF